MQQIIKIYLVIGFYLITAWSRLDENLYVRSQAEVAVEWWQLQYLFD